MPRLSLPTNTGTWLLTLLSFTFAWPPRLDFSLRTKWKALVPSFNASTLDTLDTCCPFKRTSWMLRLPRDSIQNTQQTLSASQLTPDIPLSKFSLRPKKVISKIKSIGNRNYINKLREIENRMMFKKQKARQKPYNNYLSDSFFFHNANTTISADIHDNNNYPNELKMFSSNRVNSVSPQIRLPNKRHYGRSFTKNLFISGKVDRTRVVPVLLRKFPYSDIVRLSTGCTGTLVTPFHVLTAAHCVHNGYEFRNKLEMLKVEIPDTIGVRVYYVEKIGIPEKWLNPQSRNDRGALYDFAVVRLSYGVHGRSKFLPLAIPSQEVLHEKLQFLGFPLDSLGLWRSVCSPRSNKALMDGKLILTRCDSSVGNSGAAVLAGDSRTGHRIIGVLSSTMPIGPTPFYNIVSALTWSKIHDICDQIGPIGVDLGVCPSWSTIHKSRRFHHRNKVIPFFG